MNWIEIAGPSGIGKSTLLNKLREHHRDNNCHWVTIDEAIIEIIKSKKFESYSLVKQKLLQLLLNSPLVPGKQLNYAQRLLENSIEVNKTLKNYEFLMASFLVKIMEEENDALFKVEMIRWYYGLLKKAAIIDAYNYKKTLVLDEGLFNNNKNGFGSFTQIDHRRLPKAVVFCTLNTDENLKRLRNRKKVMHYHKALSDKELSLYIDKAIERNELKLKKLKALNIPILEVSLADLPPAKVAEVASFINRHHTITVH